jgi:outer membrane murein-binding lipoprotein Lpp
VRGGLTLTGCVTRADFERVRRDQQEMRATLADLQVSVEQLSRRVDTMRSAQSDTKTRAEQERERVARAASRRHGGDARVAG